MTPDLSGAKWRKSLKSQNNGGCVEVADLGEHVAVRDSQNREGGALVVGSGDWRNFLRGVQSGEIGSH